MDSVNISKLEVAHDIFPYLVEYEDGTTERLVGTNQVPPGFDSTTGVTSKDVVLVRDTGLSARVYRPLVLYFHRWAPEFPFPIAFDDAWPAVKWVVAHRNGNGPKNWLNECADFNEVFLAGDSVGATMAHHLAPEVVEYLSPFQIHGIALIHPYFWGSNPIGLERVDPVRKELVDKWWEYVCPSDEGSDDPLINPFVDGAPSFEQVVCEKMLVLVAEKDILRERGRLYYQTMLKYRKVEYFETHGEDHVFYVFNSHSKKAKDLMSKLASFINN